jgi:molecular chaperone DnaK
MNDTINFGIDLGTTNSSIAKFDNGDVFIFKNPISLKQTLPSVVGFRKQRIVVGEKAIELIQKDSKNVISAFKRKIGTSDTYWVESQEKKMSPVELSTFILKELKNFIQTQEKLDAAVVTIPASFDTMQSNATKEAAHAAGFSQVVLLQEPIAASLAYVNKSSVKLENGQWLVYDFGGGTFDIALLSIQDGEMKVVDHEGDNYLGGRDLDKAILFEVIIPKILTQGNFGTIAEELKNQRGFFAKYYNLLLYKAEELKISLSHSKEVEIEIEIQDIDGREQELFIDVTREEMESAIDPIVQKTLDITQSIIRKNELREEDLHFALMVGGSTYIPYIKQKLDAQLNCAVNLGVDPTTAVVEGAAYYAGVKKKMTAPPTATKQIKNQEEASFDKDQIEIKSAYNKMTTRNKAPVLFQVVNPHDDYFYRIYRSDGGFDSGLKRLTPKFTERLPLVSNVTNIFHLRVQNPEGDLLEHTIDEISITQGKFRIDGQPVPFDISLELDNQEGETYLELVFKKGDILPLKKTIVKQISKNILKNSQDSLIINVLEGPVDNIPAANKSIGFIKIKASDLERDLVKGSDVEIDLQITESRELDVEVYISLSQQEFKESFTPSVSHIDQEALVNELRTMSIQLQKKKKALENLENFEKAGIIASLEIKVKSLLEQANQLSDTDQSDKKYQIDKEKRKLATDLHHLYGSSYLTSIIEKYYKAKAALEHTLESEEALPDDQRVYDDIIANESTFLANGKASVITMRIEQIENLRSSIKGRKPIPDNEIILYYTMLKLEQYPDPKKAQKIIEEAEQVYKERGDPKFLIPFINLLSSMLSNNNSTLKNKFGTGLK